MPGCVEVAELRNRRRQVVGARDIVKDINEAGVADEGGGNGCAIELFACVEDAPADFFGVGRVAPEQVGLDEIVWGVVTGETTCPVFYACARPRDGNAALTGAVGVVAEGCGCGVIHDKRSIIKLIRGGLLSSCDITCVMNEHA